MPDTTVNTVSFYRHIKSQIVCKVPPIAREIPAISAAYHIIFLIDLVVFFYLSSDSWVTSLWQAQLNVH
ncbi:hypothetical protein EMIT0357P_100110 [Pseudomonas marginalis]